MTALVPNRLLFKFEFPIHRCPKPLPLDGDVDQWGERYRLPPLCALDDEQGFGQVYAAWDAGGLYVGCRVGGKRRAPNCDPQRFRHSDCLRVMTDMRDTRDIRRATRFCQHWYLLPAGGGTRKNEAVGGAAKVARAMQDAPVAAADDITIASGVTKTGYGLTALLSRNALAGFDPTENPRIGFFYILEDGELGRQSLTVGDDLNWWIDPSTWPTAVLVE